jgi:putative hemolysin
LGGEFLDAQVFLLRDLKNQSLKRQEAGTKTMPANHEIALELHAPGAVVAARRLLPGARHSARRSSVREYSLRLARTPEEKAGAFRLRFLVFNLELNEGLESAYATGYDSDEFDAACDHLIVEHRPTGRIIATYRLQTGSTAAKRRGYYSEREFNLAPFEPYRQSVVEVGRAAILKEHRSFEVLNLLWKGIATYAVAHGGRYLLGCSSVASQNLAEGLALYRQLESFLAPTAFQTKPQPSFCLDSEGAEELDKMVQAPRLLRAYLNLGARICGAPAIDREFKTIDFLTVLDIEAMSPVARSRFLSAA